MYFWGMVDKLGYVIRMGRNVGGYFVVSFFGREKVEVIMMFWCFGVFVIKGGLGVVC